MRQASIIIAIATALGGLGTLALAQVQPAPIQQAQVEPTKVEIVEGKDRPILLARVVVSAAPLNE